MLRKWRCAVVLVILAFGCAMGEGHVADNLQDLLNSARNTIPEKFEVFFKCLKEGGELSAEEVHRIEAGPLGFVGGDKYDFIVNITSGTSIATTGWGVYASSLEQEITKIAALVVSFVGFFNTGKTFILNQLLGTKLPSGASQEGVTQGLSCKRRKKILFVDTEGSRRAVPEGQLSDRLTTDYLLQELALRVGDVVVFFAETLFVSDVVHIKKLRHALNKREHPPHMIVIHNMYKFGQNGQIDLHIKTDIMDAFGAIEQDMDIGAPGATKDCVFFSSLNNTISHLVFAHQHSDAGDKWNSCSLGVMDTLLKADAAKFKPSNFLDNLAARTSEVLPTLFFHPNDEDRDIPTMTDPRVLTIEPKVGNGESGFFNKVVSSVASWLTSKVTDLASKETGLAAQCEPYKNRSNAEFEVGVFHANDSTTSLAPELNGMQLAHFLRMKQTPANGKLEFFPLGSFSEVPADIAFTPRFDVFENKTYWGIVVDILDAAYVVEPQQFEVSIFGCRAPPTYKRNPDLGTDNRRRFSTFNFKIALPKNLGLNGIGDSNCVVVPTNEKGVLTLLFRKNCQGKPEL